jgi:peroxiredoxin
MRNLDQLPDDLPIPLDDHACDHLNGLQLPSISLQTTEGSWLSLQELPAKTIIFFYPRTGQPSEPAPVDWDMIPGARGCTPQSCGYRDLHKEFQLLGYQVYGLSSQDTDYQKEFVNRNHIPFEIISDEKFQLTETLNLPTFQYNDLRLIKRMAWVIEGGKIQKVFYPVFPPNDNAATVLAWLKLKA